MSASSVPSIIAIAALSGGALGGAVAWGVSGARTPGSQAAAASSAISDAEDRIAAVERRMAALERRSSLRPAAPNAGTPQPARPAADAPSGGEPPRDAPAVDDPVFEAAVRDVVQRVDEERDSERQVQREEQRQASAQRWAVELTERLGLRPEQKTKIEALAKEFLERVRDAFRTDAGAPLPFEERRERMRGLRREYEERLGTIFDPAQHGEYQKLDDDLRLGRGRAFRPDR